LSAFLESADGKRTILAATFPRLKALAAFPGTFLEAATVLVSPLPGEDMNLATRVTQFDLLPGVEA
jgi:hypothetical protein